MELVSCRLREVSMRYGEYSRQLGLGAVVDLDEMVGQRPAAVGETVHAPRDVRVRDLLEGRLEAFMPIESSSPPAAPDGQDDGAAD